MAPTSGNSELTSAIQDLRERITKVETQQSAMENDLERIQQSADTQGRTMKDDYVTRTEFALQMENLRLTISLLRTEVERVQQHMTDSEAKILREVKGVGDEQKKESRAALIRFIGIQSGVFIAILSAVIAFILNYIHHP